MSVRKLKNSKNFHNNFFLISTCIVIADQRLEVVKDGVGIDGGRGALGLAFCGPVQLVAGLKPRLEISKLTSAIQRIV
jgi:hypothetical protein